MKAKSILIIAAAAMLVGCAAPKATGYSYSEYRTISPSQAVFTAPLMADLVVSETRITYGERIEKNITHMTDAEVQALVDKERENVIANAVKANNADVLVAPIINIQTDANKNLVIVVTGYPANYSNFRNADSTDLWILNRPVVEPKEKAKAMNIDIFKKKK